MYHIRFMTNFYPKVLFTSSILFLLLTTFGFGSVFEYWYAGDENAGSRFNDIVSQDVFGGSLFCEISGGVALTLADNTLLILAYDAPRGKVFHATDNPESDDDITLHAFGSGAGSGPWMFGGISDLSADKWGNIAISEQINNRIHLFRYNNGQVTYVNNENWDLGLDSPMGVCIAEMDNDASENDNVILIADGGNNRILAVDFDGQILGEYSVQQAPGALHSPYDIEWCADETQNSEILYVVDGMNRRLVKLQGALNNLVYCYDVVNASPSASPGRIALDKHDHIYVPDTYSCALFKYKDTGNEFQSLFHTEGPGFQKQRMYFPTCVTIPRPYPYVGVAELYTDYSGAVLFKIDLEILLQSWDTKIIDPSIAETVTLEYKLTDYARDFSIIVYDSNDQPVRTLEQVALKESGFYNVVWDGKNDQMQNCPEGSYTIKIVGDDTYDEPQGGVDAFATPALEFPVDIRPFEVHISVNTIWNEAHTIYRNLIIDPGITLTLQPSAHLICQPGSAIYVDGCLDVQGISGDPVVISSTSPCGPDNPTWDGIIINSLTPNNSSISYCTINGAETGLNINQPAIQSNVSINQASIENCSFGLYLFKSTGTVMTNSSIAFCGTGVYIDSNSDLELDNVTITYTEQDGIYLHQSNLDLVACNINRCAGAGLDLLNAINVNISGTRVAESGLEHSLGVGVLLSSSSPSISTSTIEENAGYGIYVCNNSFPVFYDVLNPPAGNNTLENNGLEEMVYMTGMAVIAYGHNNLIDDAQGVLLQSFNNPHFFGENNVKENYWGNPGGPQLGQLLPTGYFTFSPFDLVLNQSDDYDELSELFLRGLIGCERGDTTVACMAFRELLARGPNSGFAAAAALHYMNIISHVSRQWNERAQLLQNTRRYLNDLARDEAHHELRSALNLASRTGLAAEEEWEPLFDELETIREEGNERDSLFAVIEQRAYELQHVGGPIAARRRGPRQDNIQGRGYTGFVEYLDELIAVTAELQLASLQGNQATLPEVLSLATYPNPFNAAVNIHYDLPEASSVRVSILDISGRLVEVLSNKMQVAGTHKLVWNSRGKASGIYFCQLESSTFVKTVKLVMVK